MVKLHIFSLPLIATALWLFTPTLVAAQQGSAFLPSRSTSSDDHVDQTKSPEEPVLHIGGDVRKPKVLHIADAIYSKDGLKNKISGNVEVYLVIDKSGNPIHLRIVRGLGYGLDEQALQAVRQYRFQPATRDGEPVSVDMYVDVKFWIKHRWF
jgi:TonB family protein